ncbi:hypothetical protein [Shewanella phage FishSpeaker]|nr:hypothetical protein [Shewanella phage FishSpeaker]
MKDLNEVIYLGENERQRYFKKYFDEVYKEIKDTFKRFHRYDGLCEIGELLLKFKIDDMAFCNNTNLYHTLLIIKKEIGPLCKNMLHTLKYVSQPTKEKTTNLILAYDQLISKIDASEYKEEYDWYFCYLILCLLKSVVYLLDLRIIIYNELYKIKTMNPFVVYKLGKLMRSLFIRKTIWYL